MIFENIPYNPNKYSLHLNKTLRLKVTNKCPFSCYFCHNEGSKQSEDILINELFGEYIKKLQSELRIEQIHLTGGEPTSHPNIIEIISFLTNIGLSVKMTSNGQFPSNLLPKLYEAGLDSINFSVHTLNPIKLSNMQKPRRNYVWGLNALEYQLNNIVEAKNVGLHVKLNTVVQTDTSINDIISFCKDEELELRLLDDLNPESLSVQKIIEILKNDGATIFEINLIVGSSSYSYNVESHDGFNFKIKAIKKTILNSLCNSCLVRDVCKEWFYGIRIEQLNKIPIIRLCIDRQDFPAVQSMSDFFKSDQYKEIINFTKEFT